MSASCHKWCVEIVDLVGSRRGKRAIYSRHKTETAAKRVLAVKNSDLTRLYRVRRLTTKES